MFQPPDIRPLTEFQRDAKAHISRLKKSGRAEILTVNGRAAVVIQDAASYQRLCKLAEKARDIQRTQESIRQADAGLGRTVEEFADEWRAKLAPKRRRKSA
ncbi:MAG: type II toxin-antitoxin system Phd/YefM family antitoxin [Planctomycetes bacterium]|nr:type II toxin-antitoxin system Phd/YefM family antitoxin [Planctomycetota bacterium]